MTESESAWTLAAGLIGPRHFNRSRVQKKINEFDAIVGLEEHLAFQVNDLKRELGLRVDRHEHIGKGKIGLAGFQFLMNDKRFQQIPRTLETPKSPDKHEDLKNLKTLKCLLRRSG